MNEKYGTRTYWSFFNYKYLKIYISIIIEISPVIKIF